MNFSSGCDPGPVEAARMIIEKIEAPRQPAGGNFQSVRMKTFGYARCQIRAEITIKIKNRRC